MKPKHVNKPSLHELAEEVRNSLGTPVGWRWWVEEYRPAHTDWDDRDWPDKIMSRSKYFDTYDEADEFMNAMVPDHKEHKLRIVKQTCYERTERYWV
jgi:hypothetical protein